MNRKVRHPAMEVDVAVPHAVLEGSGSGEHIPVLDGCQQSQSPPSSVYLRQRRRTVAGEEALTSDRNVSPRLGFLSYNSMMLKRRKPKKRITEGADWLYPIPKTEGLEAGENNKMQTRTKYTLEALLLAKNMAVVKAVIKCMNPTEVEEISGALLAVFHCNAKGHKLILWAMERELKVEKVPANLFRGVSLAASLMSKYFRMSASDYLRSILRPIVKEVKTKDIRIEVDPARIKEDPEETLRENQLRLIRLSKLVFDLLVASLDQFPSVLKSIFHVSQQAISERFPEMGHQFVGGFYFLRFICPALVAPAAYGLVQCDLSSENQRTLILISKVLQNLSNHILFGEKEPFMMFMNPFISKNSQKMSDCLQTLVKKGTDNVSQNGKFFQVSAANEKLKNEALVSVTRCICDHLDEVITELDRAGQGKLQNVLLDSLRAIAMLARSAGVNINQSALAARTAKEGQGGPRTPPSPPERQSKGEYSPRQLDSSDDVESIDEDYQDDQGTPVFFRPSREFVPAQRGEEEEHTIAGVRSAELRPVVEEPSLTELKLGNRPSSEYGLLHSSVPSLAVRRKSLDREIEGQVRVSLSLGDLPMRNVMQEKEKEKDKEKLLRKIERAHRLKSMSPRESTAGGSVKESTNPLYNPVQKAKAKDSPIKDRDRDKDAEERDVRRFMRLKSLINERVDKERLRSSGEAVRSPGSSDDESNREVRTENILLQYINKDRERSNSLTATRSDDSIGGVPLKGAEAQDPEKPRSLSASDIKVLPVESANKKRDESRHLSGCFELTSADTPLVLRELIIKEQMKRIETERELARVKAELESERRLRVEAEVKLDLEMRRSTTSQGDRLVQLLEAERLKRIEAELTLNIEREKWLEDGRMLEAERRKRIEAEMKLDVIERSGYGRSPSSPLIRHRIGASVWLKGSTRRGYEADGYGTPDSDDYDEPSGRGYDDGGRGRREPGRDATTEHEWERKQLRDTHRGREMTRRSGGDENNLNSWRRVRDDSEDRERDGAGGEEGSARELEEGEPGGREWNTASSEHYARGCRAIAPVTKDEEKDAVHSRDIKYEDERARSICTD